MTFISLFFGRLLKLWNQAKIIDLPMRRVYYYGSRMGHLALNKSFAGLRGFLQFGHTDGLFGPIIGPIQVLPHPVHSNTFYCVNTCGIDRQNEWDEEE